MAPSALAPPKSLATIARLFAVMGMEPVGYYDLSSAGVPVHSTAFRAVHEQSLHVSPFRVFTSLLRLELIDNPQLREPGTGHPGQAPDLHQPRPRTDRPERARWRAERRRCRCVRAGSVAHLPLAP